MRAEGKFSRRRSGPSFSSDMKISNTLQGSGFLPRSHTVSQSLRLRLAAVMFVSLFTLWAVPALCGREPKKKDDSLPNFSIEISAPESEVLDAVDYVVNDGMIEGSKEYNRDRFVENASQADSSPLFPKWTGQGKVFYKVREKVLAPINFKASNDEGTLAVRYVVEAKDATRTLVTIDAVFVEDFRHTVHPSNGSVETAEFKDIQDKVDAIELQKKQDEEAARNRQEILAKQSLERKNKEQEAAALALAETSAQTLEQHVALLRQQLERVVKAPGADLKSAPFQTASKLKTLDAGSEVLILVVTPYWYGIETEDGQHGWINHAQLEPIP